MSEKFKLKDSESGDFDRTPLPDGSIYEAKLTGVKTVVKPFKDDDGNDIKRVEFAFKIVDEGEFQNRMVWGDTPTTFTTHPDCKMRAWIQEILGVNELPKGFEFTEEALVDSLARIVVGAREFTDKEGNLQTRNYVSDVIRSRDNVGAEPVTAGEIF